MIAEGVVVIGVGNTFRRDDGAGPAVVEALRGKVPATLAVTDGEPARLIELWSGALLAIVVDAVRADPPRPGRVHEMDMEATGGEKLGQEGGGPAASSHALGLEHAVELGRAVDRMPRRLRVHAIEGLDFGLGPGLTPQVEEAAAGVARRIEEALLGPEAGK
ncbi:hydrogenase maturation protease [Actinomadura rugatobispora]|uniref:Hydrogenase maturation protease n=1 Tax=Actinomadura rugatobispora TaxID=1994 RepID=A0ABW1A280_9ACTN|nr:hydrogenase maturation protease [Actinomadura rugatobispora]